MKKQHLTSVVVNETQLAEHWGVTTRRVRQLVEDGVAVRAGGGFDLVASDAKFIAWLRRDEDSTRSRRRMTELRAEQIHAKLMRQDGAMLTPQEVWDRTLEAMNALRTGFNGISTYLYQTVSNSHPALALEIQKVAEENLNHLWKTMVDPLFEQWQKYVTDEQRLQYLRAARRVRVISAVTLEAPDNPDPDDIPYGQREG